MRNSSLMFPRFFFEPEFAEEEVLSSRSHVEETDHGYFIQIDAPGIKKEDVKISLENQNLVLYPNPTNSKIYVNGFNTNIEYFEVLDIMGRTVLSGNSTNDGIDLTSLSNNTYIIKLVDENGNILVKKIIKY